MEAVITALTTAVNATSIYGVLALLVPFVGAMVLVALGIHFLRRGVKGAAKGKARF